MSLGRLIGTTGRPAFLLPAFRKFPRNAGFSLTVRIPPTLGVESISGYLDCLLEFGEMEVPLDLTDGRYFHNSDKNI